MRSANYNIISYERTKFLSMNIISQIKALFKYQIKNWN
nr:MAG TPA: hypothetical protein [Caudoviricetes sp.]